MTLPLRTFTRALWHGGEIELSERDAPSVDDVNASLDELEQTELDYRRGLPADSPAFHRPAAAWGMVSLYRAAQFLVFRELPPEIMRAELNVPCPEPPTADAIYSVDLSFRFLPEMFRLARSINPEDPLLDVLRGWANDWPLSSVGIRGTKPRSVTSILNNTGLRTLYIDRILAAADDSRILSPDVIQAVQIALGDFRQLSPTIYDLVYAPVVEVSSDRA